MTSFNGVRYIDEQLESILVQLSDRDEVVLCDDASTDGTRAAVESVRDPRLRADWNPVNVGLFETLTRSLRRATGDVLFLADQDDIWRPGKVAKMMSVFESRPDVTLVLSDAEVIDARGDRTADRYLNLPAGEGNGFLRALRSVVKNRYLGAAMAFRREMLGDFLPIPPMVPMHDMWIGILSDLRGRTYYLPEPLIGYRRHDRNVTKPRSGLRQILVWRYRLVTQLARRLRELAAASSRRLDDRGAP
jgi:glycosyltransferase involved in cell wall biosynthesis